jgi:hypothetical protein
MHSGITLGLSTKRKAYASDVRLMLLENMA